MLNKGHLFVLCRMDGGYRGVHKKPNITLTVKNQLQQTVTARDILLVGQYIVLSVTLVHTMKGRVIVKTQRNVIKHRP